MNDGEFDEVVKRLKKVDKIIAELDPAIRAFAFTALEPWVVGEPTASGAGAARKDGSARRTAASSRSTAYQEEESQPVDDNAGLDRDAFFLKFNHDKPSDNAMLAAAWHYNQYGIAAFSLVDIRGLATKVGVTIPERINMTFRAATHDGKLCFNPVGRGSFTPTVHGEARLKKTYGVKKGILSKPKSKEGDE